MLPGLITTNPLDPSSPLNQGLVCDFTTAPWLYGGNTWYDLSGQYRGTLTNMTAGYGFQSTTRPGGCGEMRFDGVNDYISIPSNSSLQLSRAFAVSVWFKMTGTTSDYATIVSKGVGNISTNYDFRLITDGAGTTLFNGVNLVAGEAYASTSISLNTWYNAIVIANGSTLSTYLNGVLKTTTNAFEPYRASTDVLYIGGGNGATFPGLIDAFRIYNRALSPAEVAGLYLAQQEQYSPLLYRHRRGAFSAQQQGGGLLARRRRAWAA
jgi:hypothetical protein